MHKENVQTIYENYENYLTKGQFGKEIIDHNPERFQTSELTGSDSVRTRSSRAAPVCLVLLCFLLLTAVIVLSVLIYTKHTNYTQERNQLLTRITNITDERDDLLTSNTNLTKDREQLLIRNNNLTKDKDELLTRITNLTEDKNLLLSRNTILTKEKDQLIIKNLNLMIVRDQLNNILQTVEGWFYYEFTFYYVSDDTGRNWAESRRDCKLRGADLVIINNRQEQDFVMSISHGKECWIGLTDSEVEGIWKWVDGSSMTAPFWGFNEPNDRYRSENCVLTYLRKAPYILGWIDENCNYACQWICEKSISPLTQP